MVRRCVEEPVSREALRAEGTGLPTLDVTLYDANNVVAYVVVKSCFDGVMSTFEAFYKCSDTRVYIVICCTLIWCFIYIYKIVSPKSVVIVKMIVGVVM